MSHTARPLAPPTLPRGVGHRVAPVLPALLLTLLLALLCALQLLALLRAAPAWLPDRITVTLARGAELVLGRTELAAPHADERALLLRRDAAGDWWIASTAPASPVQLIAGEKSTRTGSVPLAAGLSFRLGAARFTVDAADRHAVLLSGPGMRWRYDGALLERLPASDAAPQPTCPDSRLATHLTAGWNRIAPGFLAMARPLVFGGNLNCGNRIALPGLPAPAAGIARTPDGFVLTAGAAPLLLDGADGGLLAQRPLRLGGMQAIVAGRTRYAVETNGDLLYLRPVSHVALLREPQQRLPDGVAWTWTRRAAWTLPLDGLHPALPLALAAAALACALATLAPALLAALHPRARRGMAPAWPGAARGAGAVLLAGAGLVLLVLQRQGTPAGPGVALVVAWAALWFLLLAEPRATLACRPAALLLAVGLLAQLDLGLGAPESSWLRHFHKSAAVLALGVGAMALVRERAAGVRWSQARIEGVLLLLAGLALVGLVLQVVYGDETGVFDLQPVEFAKLALAALTAHCLALESGNGSAARPAHRAIHRWLLTLAPSLLFGVLLAVALVQVDDYSPLVLLTVWGGALALAHALATRRHAAAALVATGAVCAVLAVTLLQGLGATRIAQWNFYADRFLVWLDPLAHPHTGEQVLLGARAIAEGGWWGADHAAGLLALGRDAGAALRVPAVQDDFAASFFLQRHGLAAGILLWLLQALFLAGLLRLALSAWSAAQATRDFRTAWLARLRCFFLVGGAAFAFAHFLLSWGTNLAMLPVMGQPMSFLSAGGSHLLFFICPLLGMASATRHPCHPIEENDDARLRPT